MNITNILRENGYKVTPQRLAVHDALYNMKSHPSAEALYSVLFENYPTMSLATVYKTLEVLVSCNLVQAINVGENSFRYDADTSNHPHIYCKKCKSVKDFHSDLEQGLIDKVAKSTNYIIESHQIYLYGICPKCQGLKCS